jgi:hypothetical protein
MKKQKAKVTKFSPNRPVAVPVPKPAQSFYPFDTMEVNTAFVVPKSQENSVRSNASRYKKKLGREFTVRRLTPKEAEDFGKKGNNWVACWRLEDQKKA